MLEVLEHTERRLRFRLGGGASTSICTLDREHNTAEIAQFTLSIPVRRKRIALPNLIDAVVRRRSKRKTYQYVLQLRTGEPVALGGFSKEDALEAARVVRDFLRAGQRGIED